MKGHRGEGSRRLRPNLIEFWTRIGEHEFGGADGTSWRGLLREGIHREPSSACSSPPGGTAPMRMPRTRWWGVLLTPWHGFVVRSPVAVEFLDPEQFLKNWFLFIGDQILLWLFAGSTVAQQDHTQQRQEPQSKKYDDNETWLSIYFRR